MTPTDLREWRKALRWSQQRAAEALGISVRAYQDRENGNAAIKRETAIACAWIKLYGDRDPWTQRP